METALSENTIKTATPINLLSLGTRLDRLRYFACASLIIVLLCIAGLFGLDNTINTGIRLFAGISGLLALGSLVFLSIKRCHDFNGSVLLSLLSAFPFGYLILSLIKGTQVENIHGAPLPKAKAGFIVFAVLSGIAMLVMSLLLLLTVYLVLINPLLGVQNTLDNF